MGKILNIKIVAKYTYDNKIRWYTDTLNNRYTKEDIIYIIKNGKEPDRLSILHGTLNPTSGKNAFEKVIINMKFLSNGNLRCKDCTLETRNIANKDAICIVNEDSSSGYILTYNLLTRAFPEVNFVFKPANGNTTLRDIASPLILQYKYLVVISDNKIASTQYPATMQYIENECHQHNVIFGRFNPLSIEECLISWRMLQIKNSNPYKNGFEAYLANGVPPYTYLINDTYSVIVNGNNIKVHNLEAQLFQELLHMSLFKYTKSELSECLYTSCCNTLLSTNAGTVEFKSKCKNMTSIDKINSLINDSLFGGLYNIIAGILYNKQFKLKSWTKNNKNKLYKLK